jgi:hypothetical protein
MYGRYVRSRQAASARSRISFAPCAEEALEGDRPPAGGVEGAAIRTLRISAAMGSGIVVSRGIRAANVRLRPRPLACLARLAVF